MAASNGSQSFYRIYQTPQRAATISETKIEGLQIKLVEHPQIHSKDPKTIGLKLVVPQEVRIDYRAIPFGSLHI